MADKKNIEQLIRDRVTYLREDTDFLFTLFESLTGYAIIAGDFDGNIVAYNEGAHQIYGYAPEEIIGRRSIEIFFPKDFVGSGKVQQLIEELIKKEKFSYEGKKVKKNGERFPAQISFSLTKDKKGNLVGFVEIVQDLTERKRAEAAAAEQLRREIRSFERVSGSSKTNITAQTFGIMPLQKGVPSLFHELIRRYEHCLDQALEQRAYKVEYNISEELRSMAEQLGFMKAGPRDVVEIHTAALRKRTNHSTSEKSEAYSQEARVMVVELMGCLASFYRNHSLGSKGVPGGEKLKSED